MKKLIAMLMAVLIFFVSVKHSSFAEEAKDSNEQSEVFLKLISATFKEEQMENNPYFKERIEDLKQFLKTYQNEENDFEKYKLLKGKDSSILKEIRDYKSNFKMEKEINIQNSLEQLCETNSKIKALYFESDCLEILLNTSKKPFKQRLIEASKVFLAVSFMSIGISGHYFFYLINNKDFSKIVSYFATPLCTAIASFF